MTTCLKIINTIYHSTMVSTNSMIINYTNIINSQMSISHTKIKFPKLSKQDNEDFMNKVVIPIYPNEDERHNLLWFYAIMDFFDVEPKDVTENLEQIEYKSKFVPREELI